MGFAFFQLQDSPKLSGRIQFWWSLDDEIKWKLSQLVNSF